MTDGVAYTVFSRGTDAAGNTQPDPGSDIFSYDITAPTAGVVQDGLQQSDQDWTNSTIILSANWSGFFDGTSGIMSYDYAAGTTSEDPTDLIDWTAAGTDTTFTDSVDMTGITSYFVSVKATDGAENVSFATSDGITIDSSDPVVSLIYEGATDQDFDYQQDSTSLIIAWSGSDATSREITDYLACLGTCLLYTSDAADE